MKRYKQIFKESNEMFKGDHHYDSEYHDKDMANEIELFLENDSQLYHSQFIPIIKNLKKKIASGKYDHKQAPKLWEYYVENGLKGYVKQLGERRDWHQLMNTKDRMILATKLADYYYDEITRGNYDHV